MPNRQITTIPINQQLRSPSPKPRLQNSSSGTPHLHPQQKTLPHQIPQFPKSFHIQPPNKNQNYTMIPSSTPQPPTLPVTAATAAAGDPNSAAPAAAARHFITNLADSARSALSNRRPWPELADRSAFSRPDSLSDAASRLRKNLAYFRVNYLTLIAAVLALSLLTNPMSLIVLFGLFAAWAFLYLFRPANSPLVLMGREFSDRETLLGLGLLTVFVVFLTSVGSILMSALTVGAAIVGVHGAFRVPEDLFLDEQDGGGPAAGLLSFFGGAAPSAAAGGGPAAGARV